MLHKFFCDFVTAAHDVDSGGGVVDAYTHQVVVDSRSVEGNFCILGRSTIAIGLISTVLFAVLTKN